jgi:predicted  nucleic acid-binding Zn-ribbon protein
MKIFGYWTMLVALVISGVAAYYSIIGLVAIFAAAAIPIIIMGAALEVGKLTTAVWLHTYWKRATWWMKSYLSFALLLLMFITSMGIFGFLSKAHIEQTAASTESVVQVQQIGIEIARLNATITRAEQKITKAEASSGTANAGVQKQIDTEQIRIDETYKRIQPAIQEQNKIIENARANDTTKVEPYLVQLQGLDDEIKSLNKQANEYEIALKAVAKDTASIDASIKPYQTQIDQINKDIETLQRLATSGETKEIKKFQQTIGIKSDGIFGSNTAKATTEWKEKQQARIDELSATITKLRKDNEIELNAERDRLRNLIALARGENLKSIKLRKIEVLKVIDSVRASESPVIKTARNEIARIRSSADTQIKASQDLIQKLRNSLKVGADADVDALIDEQLLKIKTATAEIDTLTNEKYALEAETRKLEAEVGPVKYIAEFVYGETADNTMLEEAVRWVILILVLVFDPLAVVLVIAGLTLIEQNRRPRQVSEETVEQPVGEVKSEGDEGKQSSKEEAAEIVEVDDTQKKVEEPVTEVAVAEEPTEDTTKDIVEVTEELVADEDGLYKDDKGTFVLDERGGRKYLIDPAQYMENDRMRRKRSEEENRKQIEQTIDKMKTEGRWPNPPESPTERESVKDVIREVLDKDKDGQLSELLEKANQQTLDEVYRKIIEDLEK